MTPQEKELITTLLDRLRNAGGQPKDPEADGLIRQALAAQPDAPYYLVQTVLIQDLALHNAQNRLAQLEQQVTSAQQEAARPTSFLGSLFGRQAAAPAPPPPPASAPPSGPWSRGPQAASPPGYGQPAYGASGYGQPMAGPASMLGGGGGGFLRSAAATAAGVAGGALLFQGIQSMFGHQAAGGILGGQPMAPGLGESVINNYYGDNAGPGGADAGGAGGGPDFGSNQDFSGGQDQDYGSNQDFSGGQDFGSNQDFGSDQDFSGGGDGGGDFGGNDSTC